VLTRLGLSFTFCWAVCKAKQPILKMATFRGQGHAANHAVHTDVNLEWKSRMQMMAFDVTRKLHIFILNLRLLMLWFDENVGFCRGGAFSISPVAWWTI
jgi:hypothetical protein